MIPALVAIEVHSHIQSVFMLLLFIVVVYSAHFKVRVRRKGVVALQNVEEPSMWLKIDKDRLTGDVRTHKYFGNNYLLVFTTTQGNGDEFCEFELIEKGKFWNALTVHLLNALSSIISPMKMAS